MKRKGIQSILFLLIGFFFFSWSASLHPAFATVKYWIGSSGGNFNAGANWSTTNSGGCAANGGGSAPGSSDVATFTSNCTNNVTLNATVNVQGVDIQSGYTGTLTQNAVTVTVGSGNYSQAAGTYDGSGSSSAISINGSFLLSGGTFKTTAGTLTIKDNTTISGTGTFTKSGGVTIGGNNSGNGNNATLACRNQDLGTVTFYEPFFGTSITVGSDCNISLGNSPTSQGTIINNGTITVGTGTWSLPYGGYTHNSGAILTMTGSAISMAGDFTVASGATFPSISSNLTSLTVGGSFTVSSGATFTNSSSVALSLSGGSGGTHSCGGLSLASVQINGSNPGDPVNIGSNCIFPLGTNPITKGAIANSGMLSFAGTWTHTGDLTNTSTGILTNTIHPVSSTLIITDQSTVGGNLTNATGGTFPSSIGVILSGDIGTLTCNSATLYSLSSSRTTATMGSNCTVGAFTVSSGTFDLNGKTLTATGNLTRSGGTFTANSGTVALTGTNQTIVGSFTFYTFTKTALGASDTLTFPASTTQTVTNSITLQGISGYPLSLRSSSTGTQWTIAIPSSRTVQYLDVKDSNNTGTAVTTTGLSIINSGNNTGWTFGDPNAPDNLSPAADEATNDSTPTFSFSLTDADSSQTVRYRIQISANASFTDTLIDYTSALGAQGTQTFTVGQGAGSYETCKGSYGSTLGSGNYYWRVRTINYSGQSSGYTTANSGNPAILVDLANPDSVLAPATTSPTTNTKPTWTWLQGQDSSSSGAVSCGGSSINIPSSSSGLSATTPYYIQWATNSTFTENATTTTATTNSYTHTTALSEGTWYFRVRVVDKAGNLSTVSPAGSVVIGTTSPSDLTLISPDDKSYTKNKRPTFKWRTASTEPLVGLQKYTFQVTNSDGSVYTIDNIPLTGTSDVVTRQYVIHFEGFSDTDATNNYISLYTKSSSQWGSNENNGELAEGITSWKVTATDNVGNTTSATRILYVDFTPPTLSNISTPNYGSVKNTLLTTDVNPLLTGDIEDNFYPTKIEVTIERVNLVLGIRQSKTLYAFESVSLNNTDHDSKVSFSIDTNHHLDLGVYDISFVGIDEIENRSKKYTLHIKIVNPRDLKQLLKNTKKKTSLFDIFTDDADNALADLGDRLRLRRYAEGDELARLIAWIIAVGKQGATVAGEGIQTVAVLTHDRTTSTYQRNVSTQITKAQGQTNMAFQALLKPANETIGGVDKRISTAQEKAIAQLRLSNETSSRKIQTTGKVSHIAINYTLHNPTDSSYNLPKRIQVGATILYSYIFNRSMTRISEVRLVQLNQHSATITWKTNQPTMNNKMNYGTTTAYGKYMFAEDGGTTHKVTLTNLQKGKVYYFELMSQGQNYVYDSYYSFETRK